MSAPSAAAVAPAAQATRIPAPVTTDRWTTGVEAQWVAAENVAVEMSKVHLDTAATHGQIRPLDLDHVSSLVAEIVQVPLLQPHEVVLLQRDPSGMVHSRARACYHFYPSSQVLRTGVWEGSTPWLRCGKCARTRPPAVTPSMPSG